MDVPSPPSTPISMQWPRATDGEVDSFIPSCPTTQETMSAESSQANTPNSIDAIDHPPPVATNNISQQSLSNPSSPSTFSPNFIMIACDDLVRAVDFYFWCFGWIFISDLSRMHVPMPVYLLPYGNRPLGFLVDKKAPKVTLGVLFLRREPLLPLDDKKKPRRRREHATSYFVVNDVEHTSGLIQRRKGKVHELRMGAARGGIDIGEFEDTEGNLFGIMTVRDEAEVSGRNTSTA